MFMFFIFFQVHIEKIFPDSLSTSPLTTDSMPNVLTSILSTSHQTEQSSKSQQSSIFKSITNNTNLTEQFPKSQQSSRSTQVIYITNTKQAFTSPTLLNSLYSLMCENLRLNQK